MKKQILFLVAVLTAPVAFVGCSSDLQEQNQSTISKDEVVTYQVNIPATKAVDDVTRALTTSGENDATLTSAWNGETVYVYYGDTKVGELTPTSNASNTTLSGTLQKTGGFANNDELTLYYKHDKNAQDSYTGQVGTIASISDNYDYAQATITVQVVGPASAIGNANILKTTAATFTHRQAIVRLSFTFGGTALNVSQLQISATGSLTGGTLTITPASATSTMFVALHNATDGAQNYTFTATAGGQTYSVTASGLTLADAHYYRQEIPLKKSATHLTISAIADQTYANAAITPEPEVKDGTTTLTKGTDYESSITYENNTNVGTATVTITGKGKYAGTKSQTFNIVKATPVISVADGVENHVIDKSSTLTIGASVTLGGTIDATQYASSDTNVATVSNTGVITAVAAGVATITVKSTATSNLNVATKTFDVYVREAIGGDISQPAPAVNW